MADEKKAGAEAPKAKAEEKGVFLAPHDSVKHVITFGGFPRLFVRPGAPTEVTQKVHEELKSDVGFQNLIAAKKISVLA